MKTITFKFDDESAGVLAKCKRLASFENDADTIAGALKILECILDSRELGFHSLWCANEKNNSKNEIIIKFPIDEKKK